jgi:D-amino-acid dehydrogenase
VALGPWSKAFMDSLGLRLPMGFKRGYHRHFAGSGAARLKRPVFDSENGYVLAPMARGIRLATGAEFARLDAPKNPVQIEMTLPLARKIFPLGETVDDEAWMGARPVMPDMLPVIGSVEGLSPGLSGVFANFGHAHHGLTLGPATGKLLAQIVTGETPFCDPSPYSPRRFVA